jgi:hypothetical protein
VDAYRDLSKDLKDGAIMSAADCFCSIFALDDSDVGFLKDTFDELARILDLNPVAQQIHFAEDSVDANKAKEKAAKENKAKTTVTKLLALLFRDAKHAAPRGKYLLMGDVMFNTQTMFNSMKDTCEKLEVRYSRPNSFGDDVVCLDV